MTSTSIDSPPPHRIWPGLLAASTLLVGMSTVLLHLLGMEVHRTYMAAWDITSTQFPKSTDWLLLNGYHGVRNAIAMLFTVMVANFLWLVIGGVTFALYVRLLASRWDPFSYTSAKLNWLRHLPNWLRRLGLWIFAGTLISVLIVPVTLALFLLIGIPAQVGKIVGEEIFQNHLREISKGCQILRSGCIQVFKEGAPISTGFVLDISTTHLAYFDTGLSRARVVPIDGLEIRALRAPSSKQAPAN